MRPAVQLFHEPDAEESGDFSGSDNRRKQNGKSRAKKFSAKRRKEISALGNKARWKKGRKGR